MEEKVICDHSKICPEPQCGGKEPHWYDPTECGHCPKNKEAKCEVILETSK